VWLKSYFNFCLANLEMMQTSVLISLQSTDLETLIIKSVNAALQINKMAVDVAKAKQASKTPLTIDEACRVTGLAKSTIYYLAPKGLIPCQKKGKRLYFFEDELLLWIKSGNKKLNERKEVTNA
jgi:excisionase family DNA binding protein